MKIYALITCIPGEEEPCWPRLFLTREKADAAFLEMVKDGWKLHRPEDEEGNRLPMPEDVSEAYEDLADWVGDYWGRCEVVELDVE